MVVGTVVVGSDVVVGTVVGSIVVVGSEVLVSCGGGT